MKIYEKLLNVQAELKAPKNQLNKFGGYNYRSCEDILEAAKGVLKANKLTLIVSDELVIIGERYYIKATATVIDIEDGEDVSTSAYAREEETKKGMDASQITGSASSYARKYALNGLFCIDDTKDSDFLNKEVKKLSEAQVKRLFTIANNKGYTPEDVKKAIASKFKKIDVATLTKEEYDTVCNGYENAKPKK